jgi:lipopolysaccharide transport system permease protein
LNRRIIEAGRANREYWRDLWQYRELFGFLAWRDILVRYKQTAIGAAWAILRPALSIAVGSGVFGTLAGLPSGELPYPVLVCAGTLPWYFFAAALSESSACMVSNAHLISKVYFPRLILPASALVVALVDFAFSMLILAVLMAWYEVWPTWRLLALFPLTALAMLAALGPGLLFTSLSVKYRDFRFVVPFVVQFGQFVSPVFFSSEVVRAKLGSWGALALDINPLSGIIEGFRWAICGVGSLDLRGLLVSLLVSLLMLALGLRHFRATEREFADVI